MHLLWGFTPSDRALAWRVLSSGDDAWTGFLLGGVLLALFPLPDLTAEAAPGSHGPNGWSAITLPAHEDRAVQIRDDLGVSALGVQQ